MPVGGTTNRKEIEVKVRFLSDLALATLHENLQKCVRLFREQTNAALLQHLRDLIQEEPLKETNYTLPDSINLPSSKESDKEVEAVRQLYLPLKGLPHSIACDERLWAGLCIDRFLKYTRERWEFGMDLSEGKINDHFLFMGQSKKAYTRNAIARLWWLGDLTYDEERSNPFEITEFILKDTDYIVNLLERAFSSNRNIFREFVEAVEKARAEGHSVERQEIRELCKYLNLLGGVYILDALPKGMIFEKIYAKAIALQNSPA